MKKFRFHSNPPIQGILSPLIGNNVTLIKLMMQFCQLLRGRKIQKPPKIPQKWIFGRMVRGLTNVPRRTNYRTKK